MIQVLYVIGVIAIVISIITGLLSGLSWGFLAIVASGVSSAMIFFALAKILENQQLILSKLAIEQSQKKPFIKHKVLCPKCNYRHDNDYTSCPHCGYRYDM